MGRLGRITRLSCFFSRTALGPRNPCGHGFNLFPVGRPCPILCGVSREFNTPWGGREIVNEKKTIVRFSIFWMDASVSVSVWICQPDTGTMPRPRSVWTGFAPWLGCPIQHAFLLRSYQALTYSPVLILLQMKLASQ